MALIQVRRDTAAAWTSANTTLAIGEIGFETDTGKYKIGTGLAWSALGYAAARAYSDLTGTPNLTVYLTTANATSTYAPIATTATLNGTQTLTNKTLGATSVNGTMSFLGNITSQLKLQAWMETFTSPAISAGTLTLDLSASNFFKVSLDAAISTITTTNTPANVAASFSLEFTADGTARAVTWPAAFKWTGGTVPVPTSTSGKTDTFIFYSTDTGTTWRAYVAGQNQ